MSYCCTTDYRHCALGDTNVSRAGDLTKAERGGRGNDWVLVPDPHSKAYPLNLRAKKRCVSQQRQVDRMPETAACPNKHSVRIMSPKDIVVFYKILKEPPQLFTFCKSINGSSVQLL